MRARRVGRAARASAWIAIALALGGCPGVPDLVFVDATDGGAASDAEGGVTATCPNAVPATASICCGAVACSGNCTISECSACQNTCPPGTLCCAKPNNPTCRSITAGCQ